MVFNDYVVIGYTEDFNVELIAWGCIWDKRNKYWVLENTAPSSPDYIGIQNMGLDLKKKINIERIKAIQWLKKK